MVHLPFIQRDHQREADLHAMLKCPQVSMGTHPMAVLRQEAVVRRGVTRTDQVVISPRNRSNRQHQEVSLIDKIERKMRDKKIFFSPSSLYSLPISLATRCCFEIFWESSEPVLTVGSWEQLRPR